MITKGSTFDKLSWAFTFYDVDNDGLISIDEMLKVLFQKKLAKSFSSSGWLKFWLPYKKLWSTFLPK